MLVYKSAYRWEDSVCLGEVLDFPGTVSFGHTLDEARKNLAGALLDMGETNLLRGEPLPLPDPDRSDPRGRSGGADILAAAKGPKGLKGPKRPCSLCPL